MRKVTPSDDVILNTLTEEKKLIQAMFESASAVFPMFDNISAYLIVNGRVQYIASKFFPLDEISDIDVIPSYFHINANKPYIMKDVATYTKEYYGQKGLEIIDRFGGIKIAIFIPFIFDSGVTGGLHMGFWGNSTQELTDKLIQQVKLFQKTFVVFYDRSKVTSKIKETQMQILQGFMTSLEGYDKYTKDHSRNVTSLCMKMADLLDLSDDQKSNLYYAASLHDIGKIYVNRNILNKTTVLTEEEFDQVKSHPEYGYKIVQDVLKNSDIADVVLFHHERFDGQGYPKGIQGDQIPLLSRIITICDSYDAMTSERAYKQKCTISEAKEELKFCSNKQFDGTLVDIFLNCI